MAKISILIVFLAHLLCAMTQRQPSPCSKYFTYMTKPGITDMLGQIEIPSPSENDTFFLKVALDTTTGWPSQVARLELAQTIQESVRNVHQSKPLLYHVYYGLIDEPIPFVSAIWFNDKQYCPSSEVSGKITATIELGHILYTPNEEQFVYNDGPWQLNSLPWDRNSSIYRRDTPNYDRLNYESELNNECGTTSYYTDETNRLISDGEKTLPGQWPWLVAIYIQRPDNESAYDFKGAGSLLTTRHVITEKYCIWNFLWSKGDAFAVTYVDPLRVHVSFGQFKSSVWHGNQTRIINRMILDYKPYQYANKTSYLKNNGLAILILETAVEYNAFIKPVCLWSGSTDLQNIVNMTGYLVGWGYDVKGHLADIIKNYRLCIKFVAIMPSEIVSIILLKIFFYNTSDNPTYQGYVEEPRTAIEPLMNISTETHNVEELLIVEQEKLRYQIPCTPGGGLVVYNITTNHYELRGIALYCTLNATVYIDVAPHLSWIREQISII